MSDSTSLTLSKFSEMLNEIRGIFYFVNPFIPKDSGGAVIFFHLEADDVYLVCPENEEIFKTVVTQVGLKPVLLSRDEWAERSMKRHPPFSNYKIKDGPPKEWEFKWSWQK